MVLQKINFYSALMERKQCRKYIEGIPSPTHQAIKCKGMPKFFDCVQEYVRKKCNNTAVFALTNAITKFGCYLHKGFSFFVIINNFKNNLNTFIY